MKIATFFVAFSLSTLMLSVVSLAAECTCDQHDAKATGDSSCSRTESSSYCTISYGSSSSSRSQVMELLESNTIQGEIEIPESLSPILGPTTDSVDAAYRVLNAVGNLQSGLDLTYHVREVGSFFNTVLMINFALSAVLQEDTKEQFVAAMKDFFSSDLANNKDIMIAFTTGDISELTFGSSKIYVNLGCASLTYGSDANTIIIANEKGQSGCE